MTVDEQSKHVRYLKSLTEVEDKAGGRWKLSPTTSGDAGAPSTSPSHLSVSHRQVKKQLEGLDRNKAAGPDGISPRVPET